MPAKKTAPKKTVRKTTAKKTVSKSIFTTRTNFLLLTLFSILVALAFICRYK